MSRDLNYSANSVITSANSGRFDVPKSPLTRIFDIALILIAIPYILLFFLVISFFIVLDSKGRVIYGQPRIGMGGRTIKIFKFRTTVSNVDQILQRHLDESPNLNAEWLATPELKQDPRITRVGRILRKLSLDELPQFWNILIGDLSLIGPRPITDDEIEKYGKSFELYIQARPGLTGLWQVSENSIMTYKQRVELDEYYLLNRSIKLDIQIILKTVYAVMRLGFK